MQSETRKLLKPWTVNTSAVGDKERTCMCVCVCVAVSLSTIWFCMSCTAAVTVLPPLGAFVPFALWFTVWIFIRRPHAGACGTPRLHRVDRQLGLPWTPCQTSTHSHTHCSTRTSPEHMLKYCCMLGIQPFSNRNESLYVCSWHHERAMWISAAQ